MSDCVVRMVMPEGCLDCPCVNGEYGYCQADEENRPIGDPNERPSWCPIICSLPEGHGRLVDADALHKIAWPVKDHTGRIEECVQMRDLYKAPTIVPAERKDNGETC